jgi:DNA-binding transcriptional MerR regulator
MSDRRRGRRGTSPVRAFPFEGGSPEPRYAIAAVAARTGVHITTIRRYEEAGVVEAVTVQSGARLYSEADIDRIWRARRLIDDLGVNLAGAAAILHLREQLIALQREFQVLQERTTRS